MPGEELLDLFNLEKFRHPFKQKMGKCSCVFLVTAFFVSQRFTTRPSRIPEPVGCLTEEAAFQTPLHPLVQFELLSVFLAFSSTSQQKGQKVS